VNGKHAAESYTITWDGRDMNGLLQQSGTYFVRMISGNKTEVQKIQIVR
jgi:flagellar hook assembly protein FlgD